MDNTSYTIDLIAGTPLAPFLLPEDVIIAMGQRNFITYDPNNINMVDASHHLMMMESDIIDGNAEGVASALTEFVECCEIQGVSEGTINAMSSDLVTLISNGSPKTTIKYSVLRYLLNAFGEDIIYKYIMSMLSESRVNLVYGVYDVTTIRNVAAMGVENSIYIMYIRNTSNTVHNRAISILGNSAPSDKEMKAIAKNHKTAVVRTIYGDSTLDVTCSFIHALHEDFGITGNDMSPFINQVLANIVDITGEMVYASYSTLCDPLTQNIYIDINPCSENFIVKMADHHFSMPSMISKMVEACSATPSMDNIVITVNNDTLVGNPAVFKRIDNIYNALSDIIFASRCVIKEEYKSLMTNRTRLAALYGVSKMDIVVDDILMTNDSNHVFIVTEDKNVSLAKEHLLDSLDEEKSDVYHAISKHTMFIGESIAEAITSTYGRTFSLEAVTVLVETMIAMFSIDELDGMYDDDDDEEDDFDENDIELELPFGPSEENNAHKKKYTGLDSVKLDDDFYRRMLQEIKEDEKE